MKKKVLFVVDKPNWAYEFMVKSWMPYLMDEYDCYLAYQQDFFIKTSKYSNKAFEIVYNVYSSMKRTEATNKLENGIFYNQYKTAPLYKFIHKNGEKEKTDDQNMEFDFQFNMAFYFQYTAKLPFRAKRNFVGIFTDGFPHDGPTYDLIKKIDRSALSRQEFYNQYLAHYDHLIVGGGGLLEAYQKLTNKVSFVYGIYGEDNFVENKNVGENNYLTIGWTGTPDRPMKGFRTIIEPAILALQEQGFDIRLKTKFSGPYEDLYTFYEDVDVVVIASSADSGPSLYAEACLSSVPVISTKVGLPLLGIKDNETGFFIERNIEDLISKLKIIYLDREKLKSFSKKTKMNYLDNLGNEKSVTNVLKLLS